MASAPSPTNKKEIDVGKKADAEKRNTVVAQMYDVTSLIWEEMVGDHFHVGFYDTSSNAPGTDVRSAQVRMIEEALRFASISGQLPNPSLPPSSDIDQLPDGFQFSVHVSNECH